MKKLVFAVCFLCTSMFFACGNKTESTDVQNDTDSIAVVDSTDSVAVVDSLDSIQ